MKKETQKTMGAMIVPITASMATTFVMFWMTGILKLDSQTVLALDVAPARFDRALSTTIERAVATDAPRLIPFQAYLTDTTGKPVEGPHDLTFKLFNLPSGGQRLAEWSETHFGIPMNKGMVNVILGSVIAFPDPSLISFDQELFIEVQVGMNPAMVPRQQIIPAIFAADADRAEHADHASSADHADALVIPGTDNLAVTVDSAGRVGLGTLSPSAKLDIDGRLFVNGNITATGTYSGFGIMPIGSIIAWHRDIRDLSGAMPLSTPDGWLPCNGQTISDVSSVLNGVTLPNLNGERKFLRGVGSTGPSGHPEGHMFKSHTHDPTGELTFVVATEGGNEAGISAPGSQRFRLAAGTAATGGDETRPINMSVVWIMRVK